MFFQLSQKVANLYKNQVLVLPQSGQVLWLQDQLEPSKNQCLSSKLYCDFFSNLMLLHQVIFRQQPQLLTKPLMSYQMLIFSFFTYNISESMLFFNY